MARPPHHNSRGATRMHNSLLPAGAGTGLFPAPRSGQGGGNPYVQSMFPRPDSPSAARRLLLPWNMPTDSEFRSTNVIFWGRRRTGKTLSMVACSKILSSSLHRFGWKIQSNIQVDFADNCDPMLGLWINEDMDRANRSLLDIDELTELVPSTRAMSGISLQTMSLMIQIRKLESEVLATTQFPTDILGKMQRQLDLYVLCDAHIWKNARFNKAAAKASYVRLYVFDVGGQFSNLPPIKFFPPPMSMAIKTITLHNLDSVWGSYNTLSKVASVYANDYSQGKLISRQWNTAAVDRSREAIEKGLLTTEEAEMEAFTDARFAEAAAHPTAPPPDISYSMTPVSIEGWLRDKRTAGRNSIHRGTVKEVQQFIPSITKLDDVLRLLEGSGFDVWKEGRFHYAEVKQ